MMICKPEDLPVCCAVDHGKLGSMIGPRLNIHDVFYACFYVPCTAGRKTMKNRKTLWIAVLAVIAAVMLGIFLINRPKTMEGSKSIVIEVLDKEGELKNFSGKTDAEFLKEAMDDFSQAGFTYKGSESEYGLYITEINGETASDEDKAYWAIYVNGEYGQYGADQQPVTDGDTYRFAYETY